MVYPILAEHLFLRHEAIHFLLSISLEIIFPSPLLLLLLNQVEDEVVEVVDEAEEVVEVEVVADELLELL